MRNERRIGLTPGSTTGDARAAADLPERIILAGDTITIAVHVFAIARISPPERRSASRLCFAATGIVRSYSDRLGTSRTILPMRRGMNGTDHRDA